MATTQTSGFAQLKYKGRNVVNSTPAGSIHLDKIQEYFKKISATQSAQGWQTFSPTTTTTSSMRWRGILSEAQENCPEGYSDLERCINQIQLALDKKGDGLLS